MAAFFAIRNRKALPQKQVPDLSNPYLAARREWDERYGDQITHARNWRSMAFLSGVVSLIASGGMIWQTSKSQVVPFVVVTDSLGRSVASGIADQASPADERARRASIS
jgi:type IV secretion system protein TrbF